ncbi:unnamed protein product [Urochloa humidicola]
MLPARTRPARGRRPSPAACPSPRLIGAFRTDLPFLRETEIGRTAGSRVLVSPAASPRREAAATEGVHYALHPSISTSV